MSLFGGESKAITTATEQSGGGSATPVNLGNIGKNAHVALTLTDQGALQTAQGLESQLLGAIKALETPAPVRGATSLMWPVIIGGCVALALHLWMGKR